MTDNTHFTKDKTSQTFLREAMTPAIAHEFIRTSFYLPPDVMSSKRYMIEPIKIIPGSEWLASFEELMQETVIGNYELVLEPASFQLLAAAKNVGISVRYDKLLAKKHIVAKIWYAEVKPKVNVRSVHV